MRIQAQTAMSAHLEVDLFQLLNKSLPGWLRKLGVVCLISEFVSEWQGPEPPDLHQIGAVSFHTGPRITDPGSTLWFYLPPGPSETIDPDRLADAGAYIMQRLERKSHTPTKIWKSLLFASAPPANI
jgi:hypothetical protein